MSPSADAVMRAHAATLPVPEFENPAFSKLHKPLSQARVAIVTSAALHRRDQQRFGQADTGFRAIDRADRELVVGHWSPNFDHTGFQLDLNDVLERGLALLEAIGPVLETYPEVIESDETPMGCALPPRYDPDLAPAVDEAQGLRAAYDRALASRGVTGVGRAIDADTIPAALDVLHRWARGALAKEVPLPGKNTVAVAHDIRTYYEEAATQLVTGPLPGGRAAAAWFFETTEAGRTLMAARAALKDQGAPFPFWFYMAPAHR